VRSEDGVVGVTGGVDDGRLVWVREEDRFRPVTCAVDEDRCVVGGLLPPGAVSAEVVDDRRARVVAATAEGAYIAMLEQPDDPYEPVVCCRDAAGRPVRRPLAGEYPSVAVTDAQDPCPACGATDFEEYRPFEEWRGGEVQLDGATSPSPVVSCRVCGHEEQEGIFVTAPDSPDRPDRPVPPAERLARVRAMRREHMWQAVAPGLQVTDFPIYAADGWPAQLSGCGTEDDGRLTEVKLLHFETEDADASTGARPRLAVTTTLNDPLDQGPLREARQALQSWVGIVAGARSHMPRGISHAAIALWIAARRRERHTAVLGGLQSEQIITIDDTPTPVLMLAASDHSWVAVAVRGDLTLTVAGFNVSPDSLRLQPIADPAKQFGPEPVDA
jgi:hypothetical protein